MLDYDYSERISYNECRIGELKGAIYVNKMAIKALEKENKRCVDAMNNLTSPININKDNVSMELKQAKSTIKKLKMENKELKKTIYNLNTNKENTSKEVNSKNIFDDLLKGD